jgi:fructuronate reductase
MTSTTRLGRAALGSLPKSVARPAYDRATLQAGIVHLGIGAFHRAHQAVYVDDCLADTPEWGIVGASLRSPTTRDALKPQDWLYTLSVRCGEGERLRVIGSILDILVATGERQRLLNAMTDPRVRIVSLTVTEKGYHHDPATGELNEADPDIRHDLATPTAPETAPGLIVEALARRRAAGVAPFTVLTCDNLPSNGGVVKRILTRFAQLRDADLGAFVAGEVACPSTMVDRITPATTDEDRARVDAALGCADAWPVVTEPFTQWVIEDHFPSGRPRLESAGAELVSDVAPYEQMKLRLLNGAHSSLSYLGYLAGYQFVSDVMADPSFARFVAALIDEAIPTLRVPPSMDLAGYKAALLARFRNPALKHRTWQICMDGSQKLPQRLLGTIRENLAAGRPFGRLALGVAGWMRYVTGIDETGKAIDVRDPLVAELRALADAAGPSAERLAHALLGVEKIFGSDLAVDPRFVAVVTERLTRLLAHGAKRAVAMEERLSDNS